MNRNPANRIMYDTRPFLLSLAVLIARITVGALLFYAGGAKLFGWMGFGLQQTLEGYAKSGFSAPWAYMSIFTEFIGGALLVPGLFTRPAAFLVIINMTVATWVTMPNGLTGPTGGHVPLMYLVMTIIIFLAGPMAYSLDWILFRRNFILSEN
jgi:putative oxidoreductase